MNELSAHLRLQTKMFLLWLAACIVVWIAFPQYRAVVSGLMLGGTAGYVNGRYLAMKVRQMADLAAQHTKGRVNFGFLTRASVAALVCMLAWRAEAISLPATIIGLFVFHLSILFSGFWFQLHNKSNEPQGKG